MLALPPEIVISSPSLRSQILDIFKILFLLTRKYDPVFDDPAEQNIVISRCVQALEPFSLVC